MSERPAPMEGEGKQLTVFIYLPSFVDPYISQVMCCTPIFLSLADVLSLLGLSLLMVLFGCPLADPYGNLVDDTLSDLEKVKRYTQASQLPITRFVFSLAYCA